MVINDECVPVLFESFPYILSCGSTFPKFWVVPPVPLDSGLSSPLVSYPPFPSHVLVWLDPLEMVVIPLTLTLTLASVVVSLPL